MQLFHLRLLILTMREPLAFGFLVPEDLSCPTLAFSCQVPLIFALFKWRCFRFTLTEGFLLSFHTHNFYACIWLNLQEVLSIRPSLHLYDYSQGSHPLFTILLYHIFIKLSSVFLNFLIKIIFNFFFFFFGKFSNLY